MLFFEVDLEDFETIFRTLELKMDVSGKARRTTDFLKSFSLKFIDFKSGYENSLESYEALWIDPMQKALRPVSKRYPDRGFDLLPFCN